MAKTARPASPGLVCVQMRCSVVLGSADAPQTYHAGSQTSVEQADAQRLIDLGAAIRVDADEPSATAESATAGEVAQ
ncbi:MAG: hypothetical protein L6Q68_02315 [Aquabacterium sp.]|nr:hypothetical protein [Aquabacterium sp.]